MESRVSLKYFVNGCSNKSPVNDGHMKLQSNSITHFGTKLNIFLWTLLENQKKKILSVSQRQAKIKWVEKPNKGKRLIQNWRPISLLSANQNVTITIIIAIIY